MTAFLASWRVALRIARRSARRHRTRSALILLMLFLPAYAGSILVVSWTNLSGSAEQQARFVLGAADFEVSGEDSDAIRAGLPPGARVTTLLSGRTAAEGPAGLAVHDYASTDVLDPANRGRYVLRDGRAPGGAAEVAVTGALARTLGVRVGGTIRAGVPPRPLTVVGVIDVSRSLRTETIISAPETPLSGATRRSLLIMLPPGVSWTPPFAPGQSYVDREALRSSQADLATQAAAVVLVAGFVGAQIVALTAAAFMIGARRQEQELRMLSAVGATGKQIRRLVLAGGLLLGAVAAGTGAVLGVLTFLTAGPMIEKISDQPLIDVSVSPWPLLVVAGFVVLFGMTAAYLPARSVSRRRAPRAYPGGGVRRGADIWLLLCGLAALTAGTVALGFAANPEGSVQIIAAGTVSLLAGAIGVTPFLVRRGVPALARLLGLSGRLAVRHAARHYVRTGAAVAAVTAAVSGSVALALVGGAQGATTSFPPEARAGLVGVPAEATRLLGTEGVRRLAALLPARDAVTLHRIDVTVPAPQQTDGAVTDTNSIAAFYQRDVVVGGEAVIRLVTGRDAYPAEIETLERGGAVAFNEMIATSGRVTLSRGPDERVDVPAVVAERGTYYTAMPGLVLSERTARRLGLVGHEAETIVDTTRAPTPAELARAQDLLLRKQVTSDGAPDTPMLLTVYRSNQTAGERVGAMFWVLAAVSAVITVAAGLVSVGLSAAEMRHDLATMTAIGATPKISRRIRVLQGALIGGIGTVFGLVAGVGPAAGYVAYHVSLSWRTPWVSLALVLAVPPLVAMAAALVIGRADQPTSRRVASA